MFDKFSKNYNKIIDNCIKLTGFDTPHFINAKLSKLREINPSFLNRPINFLAYGFGQMGC
tara:strand:- start:200 stop:379 length:180 start_codon:yes stop_codon:yes gene_type:complete